MVKEKEFLKEIATIEGVKDNHYNIGIYYYLNDDDNVIIDFNSITEELQAIEQRLLEITKQE